MKTVVGIIAVLSLLSMVGFVGGIQWENIGELPGFICAVASLAVFFVSLFVLDYLAWRDYYR